MKASIIYAYIALMGMASAQDACVEGKRVTISPGYTVEYKCGKYRQGTIHNNVLSHEECAAKCQVGNLDVCSYLAKSKRCVVGRPDGKDLDSAGVTYMVKVEEEPEDPFAEEDPFGGTCEEHRDALAAQFIDLQSELDRCGEERGNLQAALDNVKGELDKLRSAQEALPKSPNPGASSKITSCQGVKDFNKRLLCVTSEAVRRENAREKEGS